MSDKYVVGKIENLKHPAAPGPCVIPLKTSRPVSLMIEVDLNSPALTCKFYELAYGKPLCTATGGICCQKDCKLVEGDIVMRAKKEE